jgi:hypothetical protein
LGRGLGAEVKQGLDDDKYCCVHKSEKKTGKQLVCKGGGGVLVLNMILRMIWQQQLQQRQKESSECSWWCYL